MAASPIRAWSSRSRASSASRPTQIAMVGDSRHDLEAARAAGAVAVAVLSGPADRAALAPLADHVVDDIAALPALFAALNRAG